jgi:hypothetical protein
MARGVKYRKWSNAELARLREAAADGTPLVVLATELGISVAKVNARAHKLGLRFGQRMGPLSAYHPQVAVDRWQRQSDEMLRQIAELRA